MDRANETSRPARLLAGCLPALALLVLTACSGPSDDTAGAAAPAVSAPSAGFVVVRPQEVAITSDVAGRVVALRTAEVRPQVNGLVEERVFREGSEVKAGDVLYRLDSRVYEATVASAEATLQRAEAGLVSASARSERYDNLSDSRVVSQADRDEAEALRLQAQADVAVARANLEAARIDLSHTTITAPIAGRIGTSTVDAGTLVIANQAETLATIRQFDPVHVDFTESSGNLLQFRAQLENGAPHLAGAPLQAEVRLAFANGQTYGEVGSVDAAEQFVSETTSSFTIRSRFANPDRALLPGMYVRGTIRLAIEENGYLLPQRAVSRDARGQATAFFLKPDDTVELRTLTISTDIGAGWLVTGGVREGDRLVVDGLQRLREAQAVTPVEVRIDERGIVRPVVRDVPVAEADKAPANGGAARNGG